MDAVLQASSPPTQAEFHQAIARRADHWYGACLRITRNPDMAEDAVYQVALNTQDPDEFERAAQTLGAMGAVEQLRGLRESTDADDGVPGTVYLFSNKDK
jgi:hypothetical protein